MNALNVWNHFCTITRHRQMVMRGCFDVGLYWQGLLHDLSKYTPSEFLVGCKYYQGNRSPNDAERRTTGCTTAWLHHKGRNRHHLEYWIDYGVPDASRGEAHKGLCGMKMPVRYVAEMYIDRVAASKNYLKEQFTDKSPLEYYERGKAHYLMHEDTRALLELLLVMRSVRGGEAVNRFLRQKLLRGKVPYERAVLERYAQRVRTATHI